MESGSERKYIFTRNLGDNYAERIAVNESELTKEQKELMFAEAMQIVNRCSEEVKYWIVREIETNYLTDGE